MASSNGARQVWAVGGERRWMRPSDCCARAVHTHSLGTVPTYNNSQEGLEAAMDLGPWAWAAARGRKRQQGRTGRTGSVANEMRHTHSHTRTQSAQRCRCGRDAMLLAGGVRAVSSRLVCPHTPARSPADAGGRGSTQVGAGGRWWALAHAGAWERGPVWRAPLSSDSRNERCSGLVHVLPRDARAYCTVVHRALPERHPHRDPRMGRCLQAPNVYQTPNTNRFRGANCGFPYAVCPAQHEHRRQNKQTLCSYRDAVLTGCCP